MNGQPRQWGLTGASSTERPKPEELKQNAELVEELKRENNYEGHVETQRRIATLKILSQVNIEFVKEVSRRMRKPPAEIEQYGGKVYPYGSYRLGVYGPGSDIDTLAVAPQHVTREDFFALFPDILRRLAPPGSVGSLTAVPDSFVPIIKLVLNNIEIDLIFVAIQSLVVIPRDLSLNNNQLLDGLDQPAIRAITGPRVTDEILSLVPEQKTFRTALRAIKLWAQRRAIYANIVGFPGGVAWAMMVARVCQMYPHAIGATIVQNFFRVMAQWPWDKLPVMLKDVEPGNGKHKVWNPKVYRADGFNLMPVITPAYPSMCATYNISKSGKVVITRELVRAGRIANEIFDPNKATAWKDLFKKHTFFTADHRYYLSVIASSTNPDAAKAWSGLVESKVRHMVTQLEALADTINLARPFTKGFRRVHKISNEDQKNEVLNGSTKYQVEGTKTVETTDPELVTTNGEGAAIPDAQNASPEVVAGEPMMLYTITFYIGIDLTEKAIKSLNISAPINAFIGQCQTWPNYNNELHFLKLIPCKNYELPADLFDTQAGEAKPTKPQKPKKAGVKRTFAEVDAATNGDEKRQEMITPSETPTPA